MNQLQLTLAIKGKVRFDKQTPFTRTPAVHYPGGLRVAHFLLEQCTLVASYA